MGTEKRERQKANKAMKNQQAERAASRSKSTRLGLIVGGSVVAVLLLAFIANQITGGDDEVTGDTLPAVTEAETDTVAPQPSTDGVVFEPTGEFVPDGCPSPDGSAARLQNFDAAPPMCLDPAKDYSALVTTNKGDFTIALDQAKAPLAANNFVYLARQKYFDDTFCHRIIVDFVVQCGDPEGTGRGGPGYQFADELPAAGEYQIGSIAMANSGPNTNGSQFFIITGANGVALPPLYSLFGEVTEGYEPTVVDMTDAATNDGTPSEVIDIVSVEIITN